MHGAFLSVLSQRLGLGGLCLAACLDQGGYQSKRLVLQTLVRAVPLGGAGYTQVVGAMVLQGCISLVFDHLFSEKIVIRKAELNEHELNTRAV